MIEQGRKIIYKDKTLNTALVLIVIFFLICNLLQYRAGPYSDVSWFLYIARKMIQGYQFGTDYVDVNPPLIVLISAFITSIANLIKVNSYIVLMAFIYGLIGVSLSFINILLKKIEPNKITRVLYLILFTGIFLLPPYGVFAQREHMILILVTPYLLLKVIRMKNETISYRNSLMISVFSGIGFFIKPYMLTIWIVTEVITLIWLQKGNRRVWDFWKKPEFWTVLTIGLVYLITLLAFFSIYLSFIRVYLPLYLKYDFWPLSERGIGILGLFILMLSAVYIFLFRNLSISVIVWGSFVVVAFFLPFSMKRDWNYYYYPFFGGIWILMADLVLSSKNPFTKNLGLLRATQYYLLAILIWMSANISVIPYLRAYYISLQLPPDYEYQSLKDYILENTNHDYIYIFSTSVFPSFPLIDDTNTEWGARLNCLCHLSREGGASQSIVDEMIISDLYKNQPKLLIIDTKDTKQGFRVGEFDLENYYTQYDSFNKLMKNYHFATTIGGYKIYHLKT